MAGSIFISDLFEPSSVVPQWDQAGNLGVLLLIGGALSMLQMAKDIFPAINIPVVGIIWTYNQKFSAD
jgi:hypothetical protein